ncbi:hypothetical protein chiPu_0019659 [Chiloscyllium punctatum]|uniref:Uncharacterized protein n=1 Tax=Chiloscyllium punctatum TaxID=137246 RepID=A0A401RSS8_CHIPU|nr:hypothetical protein [Chiloscyllium punctatum]
MRRRNVKGDTEHARKDEWPCWGWSFPRSTNNEGMALETANALAVLVNTSAGGLSACLVPGFRNRLLRADEMGKARLQRVTAQAQCGPAGRLAVRSRRSAGRPAGCPEQAQCGRAGWLAVRGRRSAGGPAGWLSGAGAVRAGRPAGCPEQAQCGRQLLPSPRPLHPPDSVAPLLTSQRGSGPVSFRGRLPPSGQLLILGEREGGGNLFTGNNWSESREGADSANSGMCLNYPGREG